MLLLKYPATSKLNAVTCPRLSRNRWLPRGSALAVPGSGDQSLAVGAVFMVLTGAPSPLREGSRHWGDVLQVRVAPARRHSPGLRHKISQGEHRTSFCITLSHLLRTPGHAEWSHLQARHLVHADYRHIMEIRVNIQFAEDQPVSLNWNTFQLPHWQLPLPTSFPEKEKPKKKRRRGRTLQLQSAQGSLGERFILVVYVLTRA